MYGHNRVFAQSCGHNHAWAKTCIDTNVFGHNRDWAQMCLDTGVWAQACMSIIEWSPLGFAGLVYITEFVPQLLTPHQHEVNPHNY